MMVKNCFLCVPLRAGLLIWGYSAVIIIYTNLLFWLYELHVIWTKSEFNSNQFILKTFILLFVAMYLLFHVVLISGLHNRSSGLLDIYKGFLTIWLILEGIFAALYIPLSMYQMYQENIKYYEVTAVFMLLSKFLFYAAVVVVVVCILKVYILVCVRSVKSTFKNEEIRESEPFAQNPDVTDNRRPNYDSDC
ncbi:uncharacterized protein LOC112054969 [Bicyclus anynana]|uniref:Uncharacterized protein LOC112054969 n=1 Tax=Bicyclus anynana TaxID=110368 RepID=A0A6J1P0L0_BICAN|nr:uncharacterized protein LOC112054969 [Bicyclus anynana]